METAHRILLLSILSYFPIPLLQATTPSLNCFVIRTKHPHYTNLYESLNTCFLTNSNGQTLHITPHSALKEIDAKAFYADQKKFRAYGYKHINGLIAKQLNTKKTFSTDEIIAQKLQQVIQQTPSGYRLEVRTQSDLTATQAAYVQEQYRPAWLFWLTGWYYQEKITIPLTPQDINNLLALLQKFEQARSEY